MDTETSKWKWVLASVLESVVLLAVLAVLGPVTLALVG